MVAAGIRSDFDLIKHLSLVYSPIVARRWQGLPLIQMPVQALTILPQANDYLMGLVHRPFADMVLDVDGRGTVIEDWERARLTHYWFRISSGARFLDTLGRERPWWQGVQLEPGFWKEPLKGPAQSIVLETWAAHETLGFMPVPETTGIDLSTGHALIFRTAIERRGFERSTLQEQQMTLKEYERHANMVRVLLYYLATTLDYLVEERPSGGRPRPEPRKDKKPWAATHLPRIILLPPSHTAGATEGHHQGTGHHMSPRPHQRRGHWRTFHNERWGSRVGERIFIRPAWIGPREWVQHGTVYRVIEQKPISTPQT